MEKDPLQNKRPKIRREADPQGLASRPICLLTTQNLRTLFSVYGGFYVCDLHFARLGDVVLAAADS